MPPPDRSLTVRAAALAHYAEVAVELHLSPRALLRRRGVDPAVLSDPELRLPGTLVAQVLEDAAEEADCPSFGLRMAERRRLSDLGPVGLILSHQPTVRDMLTTVIRYGGLMNPSIALRLEEQGELAMIRLAFLAPGAPTLRQAHELGVGVLFRLFATLMTGRWRARSVHFTHPAPADLSVHRRVFGTALEFGAAFNGIVCARTELDVSSPTADPPLARWAETLVRTLPNAVPATAAQDARAAIRFLIPSGGAPIARVAAMLGLTPRTLQRRLAAEGLGFGPLVDEVRRDLVLRGLNDRARSLGECAALVGFSRQSSFSRWFAGSFGQSPSAWRALNRSTPA